VPLLAVAENNSGIYLQNFIAIFLKPSLTGGFFSEW
jgi:hypothetical protein